MISLKEIEELLSRFDAEQSEENAAEVAGDGLREIVKREKSLTDTCPVCMGTGGYWTDEWQEDKYCSGLGVVTADRGYGA